LIIIVAVFALIAVALLAVLAVALVKLNEKLDKLTNLAEPVAVKASDVLDNVQRVTMTVGEKADAILTRGVELTDNVSGNVEKTTAVVQQTVTTPLIKLSSMIAGVSKGISVYTGKSRSNGHTNSSDSKE
jgi:hypothetical protein